MKRAEYPLIVVLCREPRPGQSKHDAAAEITVDRIDGEVAAQGHGPIKRVRLVGNEPGLQMRTVAAPREGGKFPSLSPLAGRGLG